MDIKKWFQPEPTKKAVYEGIYPVVITNAKAFEKEQDKEDDNGKKYSVKREVVALTFKTLSKVPFPDQTSDYIVVEQQYYFDVSMHVNALNGIGRAFGIEKLENTEDFEGKVGIIGIINRDYTANDGSTKTVAQHGYGLFSYAPMSDKAEIEYIANEIPTKPTEEEYKEWFKKHLGEYKQPK